MKRCPECNRTYADDTITFCLADGSLLSAPYNPQATQHLPASRSTEPPPTEIMYQAPDSASLPPNKQARDVAPLLPTIASPTLPESSNDNLNTPPAIEQVGSYSPALSTQQMQKPTRLYWIIGILAMLLIVSVAFIFMSDRTPDTLTKANSNTANAPATPASNAATNSNSSISIKFGSYENANLDVDKEKFERDRGLLEQEAKRRGEKIGTALDDLRTWVNIRMILAQFFKDIAENILVDVENGVVTLRGTVKSQEQKKDIELRIKAFASSRYELEGIRNELSVKAT